MVKICPQFFRLWPINNVCKVTIIAEKPNEIIGLMVRLRTVLNSIGKVNGGGGGT